VERTEGGVRITQQGLEVLTAAVTQSLTRNRRRERVGVQWLQLTRELAALHRLAEDMGAVGDLAVRLGKSKDMAAELHRESKLLLNEEVRDLTQMSEEIQAARMVPLGLLFEQYPRMVRDLSRELGKEVELTVEGEDTRVDRTVLEALREPLLHLVRNAIDHGLEPRDERTDAGKNPRGHLSLSARREGERLLLKVEDDGRGLDPELLKQVALRKGVIDEAQAARLSDTAAMDLIFLPGFSSKDSVSDVSGRGVGLDVVRVRMLGLGGEVTVSSHVGRGATFELLMPVSLTVAPLLFVEMNGERLCLQASSVLSALRVEHEQIRELAGRPALRVEDQVLPFAAMASILGGNSERSALEGELVLLLQGRGQKAALAVDRVLEERVQAVLPLRGVLSRFSHLSGATPLADGSLALVLSAGHLVSTAHGREVRLAGSLPVAPQVKKRRILVVDDSPLTRELLVSLLEAVGYEVLSAADGQDALETLHEQSVDIVVTDLEMPNVDGLELTRRLKAHSTLRALPVVIVTTRGSQTDRKRGMEAGADGYVTKGDLVRQDLVDVVSRLLA
jgi:two-component system sensor histidine kinase and response regulator WspE